MRGRQSRETDRLRRELEELRQRKADLESSAGLYRRLAEELRHGEDLFRSLADSANDAILVLDERGVVIYINGAGEALFGQAEEEVVGKRMHETLIPERFRDRSIQSFAAHGAGGMPDMMGAAREFQALRKDGTEFPVEVSISSVRSGERTYFVAFCRDITARKRAEEELASHRSHLEELVQERTRDWQTATEKLQRSESYYRSIIRSAVDMIIILNRDLTLRWGSPSAKAITGYSPDETYGKSILDFIHPDDLREGREALEHVLADPSRQIKIMVRFRHKDGSWHYHEAVESNLLDNPAVEGIVLNSRDVTDRVALDEELRRSERYFRALIENAYDIIAVLNADGTMGYISPSLEKVSGFSLEERLGEDAFKFFHPEDIPRVAEAFARGVQQPGHSDRVEYRWQHKDGSWHWQEAVATNLLDDPAVRGIVVNARDITDRKSAEQALRESEERYRSLVDTSPDSIILSTLDGRILMANRSSLELIGLGDPDELLGTNVIELIAPEERQKALESMRSRVLAGKVVTGEYTILRRSGGSFPGEITATLIRDAEGNPAGFIAITRDITDRRRAELALRESEERYRSVVETSPDGIILVDLEGRITMVNRSALNLFRCKEESEMVGKSVIEFMVPDEWPKAEEPMRQRVDVLGEPILFTSVRADGSRFLSESNSRIIRDAGGTPVGFLSITRDVTERKRAEERLQKLNECFLGMGPDPLENIRLLALTGRDILAADMVRYGRIEKGDFYVFSSLEDGEGFMPIGEVDDYLCYKLLLHGAKGPVTTGDVEEGIFANDPDVRLHGFASFLFHPIIVREESTGCFNMLYKDAREFSRIEMDTMAMLARAISIEEERYAFNESLRDFVDIASHELRHPVALLSGFTETLEAHGSEMDDPTREEVVGAIRQATERIGRMVMGLMNVSLVERERFHISKRRTDLIALADRVLREMRSKAPEWEFELKPADRTLECEVDPERFHDLLVILLDNAVKYSDQGTVVEVVIERYGEEVAVSVLDRGVGVPPQHRDKVFNRFYQVEEAQYHSTPGLGLGLFLARQIVEVHGGRISCEPREGGGSIFSFTLPLT
ncbi:MAG: PAS domain S-box protein [Actinomycetota bacterium]